MANTQYLREKIDNSAYTLQDVANYLGISRQGLAKKLKNNSEFKASEIKKLADMFKLTYKERNYIFFADCVDNKPTTS